jgi:CheY-like chemotaxis protein
MPRVLVVADEAAVLEGLRGILVENGMQVAVASSGPGAISLLHASTYDAVILNASNAHLDETELLNALQSGGALAAIPLVVLSAEPGIVGPEHAFAVLPKPVELKQLLDVLRRATTVRSPGT